MTLRPLALIAAAAVAACGSGTGSATTTVRANAGRPYQLYTHCGIQWAKINGTFWHATHPLSDGNGNPPVGWGNPYQNGRLVLNSSAMARFDSPAGSVTFERTSRQRPPIICS